MSSNLLDNLNPMQRQAVTFCDGNLLVLAGAGSGKTRVLVHRIAWLLSQGVNLHNILAVTFTNKAAKEMRDRLENMLQISMADMWIGTFHGLSHRLLRLHWQDAGLDQAFQIIDAEDQKKLLKRIHQELNLDLEKWPVQQSQSFINHNKEKGRRFSKASASDHITDILARVYQVYEEACNRSNLVDFSELLFRSYELWKNNRELRKLYQNRFQYILVDEFQDTNMMQYAWIKTLANEGTSLTAVGDDDQSIYSWRGADSGNMQRLTKEYPGVHTVRLEQNYRSTSTILNAANAIITNNSNRLGKMLWTDSHAGEKIGVYSAFNEMEEARYVADKISAWVIGGNSLSDVAVLYRSNAQSRVIEEQLIRSGISYRVYGGIRFFERAEIKDVLAYLRLLLNHNDDAAFARIINLPARGIGESAVIVLQNYAKSNNCSLWQAIQDLIATRQLNTRQEKALSCFINLIDELSSQIAKLNLVELIVFIINITGLREHYTKAKGGEYKQSKLENLDELITAAEQFHTFVVSDDNQHMLQEFLSHVALEAGEYIDNENGDLVNLMTLHSAKGLEFKLVFLCGMEDGLFPHIMSMETPADLEEERRLCYVGMTRAMEKLYLLHAASRRLRGSVTARRPSRFLREIPPKFLAPDTMLNSIKPATSSRNTAADIDSVAADVNQPFRLGQMVTHEYFGDGVVIGFDGDGEYISVKVQLKQKSVDKTNAEAIKKFYLDIPKEIKETLKLYGYFKSSVASHNIIYKRNRWKQSFSVVTGPPIKISKMDLEILGEGKNEKKIISRLKNLPIKTGEVFEVDKYNDAKNFLFDLADRYGYIKAQLTNKKILIDLKKNTAQITLHLKTGPRYYFGSTTFESPFFSKNFLAKFLPYKKGGFYSSKKVYKLQESLNNSNYFKKVEVKPITENTIGKNIPVKITLEPRKPKQYNFGAGFGTDTGIRGSAGIDIRYFTPVGHGFKGLIQGSEKQNNAELHYLVPGKHPATDSYDFSVASETINIDKGKSFSQQAGIAHISSLKKWQQKLRLYLQHEHYKLTNQPYENSTLLIANVGLAYSKKDNLIKPNRGYNININTQSAIKYLASSTNFLQLRLDTKYLNTFYSQLQLIFRASLGYTAIDNINDLPFSLQFYAGGTQSIRGYKYKDIGPGTNLAVGSIEIRQKIYGDWYFAIFADAGNVNDDLMNKPKAGLGIGIVWRTAIGALELTYAKAINQPGKPGRFQFSMGPEL